MNILKRVFCRVYQGCFYVAMPLMPWRKPKLLKGAGSVNAGVEYLQSLFYKDYLEILDRPSIKHIYQDGTCDLSGKDESLVEFDSYQYDRIKSETTGTNVYKKELDHSIDATRYCLDLMKDLGLSPTV
jgi:hypothetical protein